MSRLLLLVLLAFMPIACTPAADFWMEAKPGQKKILVSFAPLYCMTQVIAGEHAYVLCLLTSQGPHDYDGSATDVLKVRRADLVIYNGLSLDDTFMHRLLRSQANRSLASLNVGETFQANELKLLLEAKEHIDVEGQVHKHGTYDPHLWLGPREAMVMTKIIADKLSEIDPAHKKDYAANADRFIDELKKLEEYGKAAFAKKKHKNIITMHESLGYFARAFDLEVVGAIQGQPGNDPDGANMTRLVKLCQEKDVKLFAVEPQYPAKMAQALQHSLKRKNIEVQIVQVDPLETAPIPAGGVFNPDPAFYLTKMRENIDTLAKALP